MTDDMRCPDCKGRMVCECCWNLEGLWKDHLEGMMREHYISLLRERVAELSCVVRELAECDPWSWSTEGIDDCCVLCGHGWLQGEHERSKHDSNCVWLKACALLGKSHALDNEVYRMPDSLGGDWAALCNKCDVITDGFDDREQAAEWVENHPCDQGSLL